MDTILHTASERSATRRRVRIPCQVVCELEFKLLARECADLSTHGMAVRALLPATLGSPVLVSFRVPGSSLYIDVDGRIARMSWGRRDGDAGALLGIEFVNLSGVDRAILAARLRGVPPPVPARQVRVDYAGSVRAIARGGLALDAHAA